MRSWTRQDSAELYGIEHWGARLFSVSAGGTLEMLPLGPGQGAIDLRELVDDLRGQGIQLPLLVRASDVARRRMELLDRTFQIAFKEHGYRGRYRGVYPIKVNHQRGLLENLVAFGGRNHFGLEAGSRAELLLALAVLDDPEALLICNGYKDRAFVETALRGAQLGRNPVLVIEKATELETILEVADRLGQEPTLGVRVRLTNPGRGRWGASSGDRAKFGLSAQAIVDVVERLRAAGRLHCLRLLHFHIGSQVTSIRTVRRAVREASRYYTELVRLGAPMGTLDIGGGLAIDYDGSRTDFESSRNYSVREYASDVVAEVAAACETAGVAHPDLVTESGRATVAHCSVLLFEVIGAETVPSEGAPEPESEGESQELAALRAAWELVDARSFQEAWHDANDARASAEQAFQVGLLDLEALARVQRAYWQVCRRVAREARTQRYVPDDLDRLDDILTDTYYGNFSLFQSLPDSWAVDQLFPVLPIQRLNERPNRHAVIADVTCDSDGKISRFVSLRDIKRRLELHELRPGESYVLAVPLVGAYQEILGGLHNLFGPTNAVHVSIDEAGQPRVDRVIHEGKVRDSVARVQHSADELAERLRVATQRAVDGGVLDPEAAEAAFGWLVSGFEASTYLDGARR